jgi:hypothetical protein
MLLIPHIFIMRLITNFELASKSKNELQALYAASFNALVQSNAQCILRAHALASLENITRAMCHCDRYVGG